MGHDVRDGARCRGEGAEPRERLELVADDVNVRPVEK
jgi:hypothetical protein